MIRPADEERPLAAVEDFTILGKIGSGALADVYRVSKGDLGSEFALKRWRNEVDGDVWRKFADECRLQFRLSDHPNIVRLHWCESRPGRAPWLVTELYTESLAAYLERHSPLPVAESARLSDDILAGLAAIHEHGHLHRDVKPANVLVKHGRAALTDLGLAMRIGDHTLVNGAGTPMYLAPELVRGAAPSTRSDVYAAAATISRLVGLDVPAGVEAVLDRALSHHVGDRPADANDLRTAMRSAFEAAGWLAPPVVTASSGPATPAPARRGRPSRRAVVIAGAAVAVLGTGAAVASISGGDENAPAAPAAAARFAPGTDGSTVGACKIFEGTATVPLGDTVVTAWRNTQTKSGWWAYGARMWKTSGQHVTWKAPQWIELTSHVADGERVAVVVLVVPQAVRDDFDTKKDRRVELPAGGVKDTVTVTRVADDPAVRGRGSEDTSACNNFDYG